MTDQEQDKGRANAIAWSIHYEINDENRDALAADIADSLAKVRAEQSDRLQRLEAALKEIAAYPHTEMFLSLAPAHEMQRIANSALSPESPV